jgi:hypothetical protein
MPDAAQLQKLIGKVMTDEQFAKALAANPESALRSAGVEPTAEMLNALKGVDVEALRRMASAFGEDRAA